MVGAVLALGGLMSFMPIIALWARRIAGRGVSLTMLVSLWIAFEYFFHNAEISWPWLTFGNGFSPWPWCVQWYEYTGILGGSLWIFLLNILLYDLLTLWRHRPSKWRMLTASLFTLLLVVPPCASIILKQTREKQFANAPSIRTLIVQPNIDPYTEKFGSMADIEQVDKMVHLAQSQFKGKVSLVLTPETALPSSFWEGTAPQSDIQLALLHDFLKEHPYTSWITGATTLRFYPAGKGATYTSRPLNNPEGDRYDALNVALLLDSSGVTHQYIKSKLVVGVEMLPYPQYLRFLTAMSIDLGGTVGGLGTQDHRDVFSVKHFRRRDVAKLAPIICYESVFGEYVTDYIKAGAQALAVITNDGWWGNTPGYRQHFRMSQLRCIETRRAMARCANTGISAFITPTGTVTESLPWWEEGTLLQNLPLIDYTTFYVQHGDYIGRVATALIMLLTLFLLVRSITHRATRKTETR